MPISPLSDLPFLEPLRKSHPSYLFVAILHKNSISRCVELLSDGLVEVVPDSILEVSAVAVVGILCKIFLWWRGRIDDGWLLFGIMFYGFGLKRFW
jgi:hypothetical protein